MRNYGIVNLVISAAGLFFAPEVSSQNQANLELLRLQEVEAQIQRIKRVNEYSEKFNVPVMSRDSQGNLVLLVDVTSNGLPLYETTDNAGAAITTGVTKLRSGGILGLNLEGNGLEIGVWDGGLVNGHIEFGDRILLREGSTEDTHATHVTGTIIASGINPSAKGMAPKAKVFAYDFSNDTPEMLSMAREDQSGLILSNHSYGLITGWRFNNGWQWFGDVSISSFEDWKFGFYSNAARQWDQLAYNAPYYLIVKSAGNDRSDTGGGNFPADCNGGSGYDCLADKSVAKNILTIGAVNKIPEYQGPSSVVMSSFSSWGPTDDGRIKPDLVAAGVNIFSTYSSATNDAYGPLSGTSMSTPNATGSLALLQELHKNLKSGNYMKASTLKALAIHTVKEAGANPGPDYQFGWGLLDVEEGARVLLNEDSKNVFIVEANISNNQPFEMILKPQENTKIKATLVWTDPAGVPIGAALDPINSMLINDLDLRLVDDAGNIQYPWKLDPQNIESPAFKGDNRLDNVEKIEFANPQPRDYKLLVSHKGNLLNENQNFSLIVEYTSTLAQQTSLYWVGSNGNWNNPSNWSLTSGGTSSGKVPDASNRVVIDENSFSSESQFIELTSDAVCHSIVWLTKNESGISFNNNRIRVKGSINITSPNFKIYSSGEILLETDQLVLENDIKLNDTNLDLLKLTIEDGSGKWSIGSIGRIGEIELRAGAVDFSDLTFSVKRLKSTSSLSKQLVLQNAVINNIELLDFQSEGLVLESDESRINTAMYAEIYMGSNPFVGSIKSEGEIDIYSAGTIKSLEVSGTADLLNDLTINNLVVSSGSTITVSSGKTITLSQNLNILSEPDEHVLLKTSGNSSADFVIDGHFKLCFDYLNIVNINVIGSAIVNAGANSTINQSSGWIQDACDNVIFPDFDFSFPCINGLTKFTDKSSGLIENWNWNFGSGEEDTSNERNPVHSYKVENSFNVTLTVSNSASSQSFTRPITILSNPLPENEIILSNSTLFSFKSASRYEWYRDEVPIGNSNVRSLLHNGEPGVYFVVTEDNECNRVSDNFVITGVKEDLSNFIFPNPVSERLFSKQELINGEVIVTDILGRVWFNGPSEGLASIGLNVGTWPQGVYFLQVKFENQILNLKFYKK